MPKIFVSYRRQDSEHITGRIHDRLHPHFGHDAVLIDIDTIPFGVDFREHLTRAVAQCDILLAIIGDDWLEARFPDGPRAGQRRLDDPADFVRIEIEAALARNVPVIPVLVGRARMPGDRELPEGRLRDLAYRNAAEVRSGRDFHDHVDRLIRGIEHLVRPIQEGPAIAGARLIVSPAGDGTHRSIAAALDDAPPGSEIRIRPGVYREGLVLDKPVRLIGEGPVDRIVIESADADCILMDTDEAVVRGLTLRCAAGQEGSEFYAVDIPCGRLVLEDCDITSGSLSCVGIHGAETNPTVRNCKIHDSEGSGVLVYEQGSGTIEGCDIFANKLAGVVIQEGADPTVRNCTIHDHADHHGVAVCERGKGTIEGCDIFANESTGIVIQEEGDPTIRNCKIHDGQEGGVLVCERGRGTIEGCDIFANNGPGVQISDGGDPTMGNCKIHDGQEGGVWVYERGRGTIEGCDIFANNGAGVQISEGGDPTVRDCTITGNGYEAVWVFEGGAGTIENCNLSGNGRGAWDIAPDCRVIRHGNTEEPRPPTPPPDPA
jgi:parallel beta-helix repeat protein